jgi:hypothetical protein
VAGGSASRAQRYVATDQSDLNQITARWADGEVGHFL